MMGFRMVFFLFKKKNQVFLSASFIKTKKKNLLVQFCVQICEISCYVLDFFLKAMEKISSSACSISGERIKPILA